MGPPSNAIVLRKLDEVQRQLDDHARLDARIMDDLGRKFDQYHSANSLRLGKLEKDVNTFSPDQLVQLRNIAQIGVGSQWIAKNLAKLVAFLASVVVLLEALRAFTH